MPSDSERLDLREAVRRDVPDRPGVYIWLGESGEPLYVGKSVRLRSRMLTYLLPGATEPHSRLRHLAYSIKGFEYRQVAGELLALLLEDVLIKRLQPRHNVRQRDYLERRYLLLTDDAFPTCLVVEDERPRSGTLFGPFKDQYFVADLIALIADEFRLRACQDPRPFRRSARFDLGTCPAPCRDAVSASDYAETAARVRTFLEGDEAWVVEQLSADMEAAAEALRFERAAQARERIALCRRFATRQRFIRGFREGRLIVEEERSGVTYQFERGRLVEVSHMAGTACRVPSELTAPAEDPRFVLDRANLVYNWVSRHST